MRVGHWWNIEGGGEVLEEELFYLYFVNHKCEED
jgi:hypothetical protein